MPVAPVLGFIYPLLNVFWTLLFVFLWILWIFLVVRIALDIFRSADLSGGAKAVWLLFLIILPYLGVLVYLIARGARMHEREYRAMEAQDRAAREYIQSAAGTSPSVAEELAKLSSLKNQGVLSEDEFAAQKAKLLA
jgi:signal transduction histidine kinase